MCRAKEPWDITAVAYSEEYWINWEHFNVGPALGIDDIEDARLISAAPDLLDALTALERLAGQPHLYDDPIRVKARAAIAKALGQA